MRNILRTLVWIWALVSIGLGALAFAVVHGTGEGFGPALTEAFETIPEAATQLVGSERASIWIVVAYWLALALALFWALMPLRKPSR